MSKTIAIVGDGAMAVVCARILAEKGCRVRLWSAFPDHAEHMRRAGVSRFLPEAPLPQGLEITTDPAALFAGAELAVSAVPAQYARSVWQRLSPACPRGLPVCSTTKGIETGTLLRPTQVLAEMLAGAPTGAWPLAALSGPSIAPEVARKLPATVVAAGRVPAMVSDIQQTFSTGYFRVYTNTDIIGVEVAGAAKNVVAIAAGILDGLAAGDNAKAALLTRGLVEITRLGVAMGGARETFAGLAGLGDLVTTCVSPLGRNRTFGQAIGQGRTVREAQGVTAGVVEGVATTQSVLQLAARHNIDMPITQAVYAVIFESRSPRQAISDLMSRPPKSESDRAE